VPHGRKGLSVRERWLRPPVSAALPSASLRGSVPRKLLAENAPERVLESCLVRLDEAAERPVDERLVVSAARLVDLPPEPGQDVVVDPDRDAGLARR